ncbi:MAG: MAPEG family protein [Woeseia sp.]
MDVLYPAFVMFALTIFVQLKLAMMRLSAVREGRVNPKFYKTYQGGEEPAELAVHTRHLINLYEAPLLFYVIVIIASITGQAGIVPIVLAWAYALLRLAHSYVHLGSNNVLLRFRLFGASLLALAALWLVVLTGMLIR